VITYSDHVHKIAHPMGGMYQIPKAIEKIGQKHSVSFHYNTEVTAIAPQND